VKNPAKTVENELLHITLSAKDLKAKQEKKAKAMMLPEKVEGKFELEYVVHGSPKILYEFISTATGLSEWFADTVNVHNDIYTFVWDKTEQQAKLLRLEDQKSIRLTWLDKTDDSYFEFRIEKDDMTGDISLLIIDFADSPAERVSSKSLWDSQVDRLLHIMGTY